MIDPACGSGHFLLGGFARFLDASGGDMHRRCRRRRRRSVHWTPSRAWISIPSPSRSRGFGCCWRHFGPRARRGWRPRRIFASTSRSGDSLLHGRHFARHELGRHGEGFRRIPAPPLRGGGHGAARCDPRTPIPRRGRQPALHHAEGRGDAGRLSRDLRELLHEVRRSASLRRALLRSRADRRRRSGRRALSA